MKLLVYRWGSVSEPLFCEALRELHIEYREYAKVITNYHSDAMFAREMIDIVHGERVDVIFSYDYFPMIAMICEINRIPYVSWIYDCPQYTLLSKTLISPYNYIFCFDRAFAQRLQDMGAVHCEHYPLAGDVKMLERAMGKVTSQENYRCDVSFIGNLYNDEKNRFRKVQLSPYVAGCAEGLIQAQQKVYGYNFLKEALPEQPEVVEELVEKCQLTLGPEFVRDDIRMAADVLGMEVSAREREVVLAAIGRQYPVRLYTSSELPKSLENGQLEVMGYADYEKDLPLVYHYSKINLNITSKTIETGIPQRIFDVLSCGGFCLTNYQPEVAEYFEDGKELVMYVSVEDMLEKVAYYLSHEEERQRIAENGRRKVAECFGLMARVRDMLEAVMRTPEDLEEEILSVQDMTVRVENSSDDPEIDSPEMDELKIGELKNVMDLRNYVNRYLENSEFHKVQEILEKNRELAAQDNDLANMYYLSAVCSKERENGKITVYKSSMEETLTVFYELQNRLRRLEWWEEYDREEIYLLMEEYELSVYELRWAVETACVDKEKVWRMLSE